MAEPMIGSQADVTTLYQQLLQAWNQRNAPAFAAAFTVDGSVVGFDGSVMNGQNAIEQELSRIFNDHQTAAYVGIVREVRLLSDEVALLRSVAGLVPPGQTDINPQANSIQSLIAVKTSGGWRIALYHNTPAAFHGRPELSEALSAELRQLVK